MRKFLFKRYKRYTGTREKYFNVKKIEKYSCSELENYRLQRLEEIIRYADNNVPYYQSLFSSSGIIQGGRFCIENFTNLPLLGKDDIRNNFGEMTSRLLNTRRWKYKTTGGSTGQPLKVIHDDERIRWVNAVKDLRNEWCRVRFGDPKVRIWGSERDLFYGKESLKVRLNRWVTNTIWLNAFTLTPDKMNEFVQAINAKKPKQIKGYTTCLYELALFIEKNRLKIISPDSIVCSAGTVTDTVRQKIETVFRSRVFNSYGSREIQAMAFECERHNGLHVMSPIVHMEIVDKQGKPTMPGEIGEVILTPYFNFAMPLLRYRIGDMATWSDIEQCSCGCQWPLIKNIEGRVTECFYKTDGTVVPPEFFIHLVGVVQNDGWIDKFQVVQKSPDKIEVRLVKNKDFKDDITSDLKELTRKIQLVMSEECIIDYLFVEDIPNTPSGKYLYTLSNVQKRP